MAARKSIDTSDNIQTDTETEFSTQHEQAERILRDHMLIALGVGLVPVPIFDIAAFIGSGAVLVKRLCAVYDVSYKNNIARSALYGIGGAIGSIGVATTLAFSLGKLIPGVGTAAGMVALPLANAAFTYAVGKIFIAHFEMGGTLLDFNAKQYSSHIKELFKKGKDKASKLRKEDAEDQMSDPSTQATAAS
jgi:uncharacterized protein (DUF697 family)